MIYGSRHVKGTYCIQYLVQLKRGPLRQLPVLDLHRRDRTRCHLSDGGATIQLDHAVLSFVYAPRCDISDGCHPSHDCGNNSGALLLVTALCIRQYLPGSTRKQTVAYQFFQESLPSTYGTTKSARHQVVDVRFSARCPEALKISVLGSMTCVM